MKTSRNESEYLPILPAIDDYISNVLLGGKVIAWRSDRSIAGIDDDTILGHSRTFGPRTIRDAINRNRGSSKWLRQQRLCQFSQNWHLAEVGLKRDTLRAFQAIATNLEMLSDKSIGDLLAEPTVRLQHLLNLLDSLSRYPVLSVDSLEQPQIQNRGLSLETSKIPCLMSACLTSRVDQRLGAFIRAVDSQIPSLGILFARILGCSVVPIAQSQEVAIKRLYEAIHGFALMSVTDEFFDICFPKTKSKQGKINRRRNIKIVTMYYGLRTGKTSTLETVGSKFSITRERVRQIAKPKGLWRSDAVPFAPALDAAITFISDRMPISAMVINEELSRFNCGKPLSIYSIKQIACILRRDIPFAIDGKGDEAVVRSGRQSKFVADLTVCLRKACHRYGAVRIEDIESQMRTHGHTTFDRSELITELTFTDGFRWIKRTEGWFWLDAQRSAIDLLRRRINRVLSVSRTISTNDLRCALRKDRKLRRVPPSEILATFCVQSKTAVAEAADLMAIQPPDSKSTLKGDEAILVQLLIKLGPFCERRTLQEAARKKGVTTPSFWRCIQYCPTIARYAAGVYGIVGLRPLPGQVQGVARDKSQSRVLQEHGWTATGNIWFAYRVSASTLESGVVSIPAAKRNYVDGTYKLANAETEIVGKMVVRGASAWGIGPFLRRCRAEIGDILTLEISTQQRTAIANIGDEGLLDQFTESE